MQFATKPLLKLPYQPWSGVCLRTIGLTPLFLNWPGNRAMFSAIYAPEHQPLVQALKYDLTTWELDGLSIGIIPEPPGILKLGVDHINGSKKGITFTNDNPLPNVEPTKDSFFLNFSYVPSLEAFYNMELTKDLSQLSTRLYFTEGNLCTYRLMSGDEGLVKINFQTQAQGQGPNQNFMNFGYAAESIAAKIDLADGDNATLYGGQTPYQFSSGYFHLVTLYNICANEDCDGLNSFSYLYGTNNGSLICLNNAIGQIVPVASNSADPPELYHGSGFCSPVSISFSATKSF
ncbi:MAG: hypothetical protein AB1489_33420 [Acidobacteriota bacterium]